MFKSYTYIYYVFNNLLDAETIHKDCGLKSKGMKQNPTKSQTGHRHQAVSDEFVSKTMDKILENLGNISPSESEPDNNGAPSSKKGTVTEEKGAFTNYYHFKIYY